MKRPLCPKTKPIYAQHIRFARESICGYSIADLEPMLFSFNNPAGACATCSGLGMQQFFRRASSSPEPVARRWRDPRLGSPQRLLLLMQSLAKKAAAGSEKSLALGLCAPIK